MPLTSSVRVTRPEQFVVQHGPVPLSRRHVYREGPQPSGDHLISHEPSTTATTCTPRRREPSGTTPQLGVTRQCTTPLQTRENAGTHVLVSLLALIAVRLVTDDSLSTVAAVAGLLWIGVTHGLIGRPTQRPGKPLTRDSLPTGSAASDFPPRAADARPSSTSAFRCPQPSSNAFSASAPLRPNDGPPEPSGPPTQPRWYADHELHAALLLCGFDAKPCVASAKPQKTITTLTAAHDNPARHSNLAPLGHAPCVANQFSSDHFG